MKINQKVKSKERIQSSFNLQRKLSQRNQKNQSVHNIVNRITTQSEEEVSNSNIKSPTEIPVRIKHFKKASVNELTAEVTLLLTEISGRLSVGHPNQLNRRFQQGKFRNR